MTLLEFAKQRIQPTEDQEKAFLALQEFFDSDCPCFLLKGYAGTGKTTITKTITEYIKSINRQPVLMAPTGRAARIMQEKTGFDAKTIHSEIYDLQKIDEVEIVINGEKQFKFRFNLAYNIENTNKVFLIDEASMISDVRSLQDFYIYGSGVLLKDILDYIAPQNKARDAKMIFIGDPAQLPPVTDPISGALSAPYLKEKYNLETMEFELTMVVRQNEASGILHNANYMRQRLDAKARQDHFQLDTNFPDMHILKPEEVINKYIEINPDLELNKTAIINYTNKQALDYNLALREKLFNNRHQVAVGDILLIVRNNYNYDIKLFNGQMVRVTYVDPLPLHKSNLMSYDERGNKCTVSLKFRNITIELEEGEQKHSIHCLILDNFLHNGNPQLDYSENIALYLDFKMRNPHLAPGTKAFSDALKNDRFFNALNVKYGYALTCHKAQGGEWDSAIVNLEIGQGRKSLLFTRWLYTAITRAQNNLYIFNYRRESQFSKLVFIPTFLPHAPVDKESHSSFIFKIPTDFDSLLQKYGLQIADYQKIEKFKEILARAHQFGYEILLRGVHNYQEQYTFGKDGKKGTLIFWYNGRNQFTKTSVYNHPDNDVGFCNTLLNHFTQPMEILFEEAGVESVDIISFEEAEEKSKSYFPDEYEKLAPLYKVLVDGLSEHDIKIENILHGQWHEIYNFKRKGELAEVKFHYDKDFGFTSAFNNISKCNSNKLLQDLVSIIQTIKEENK